ncbi:MAG: YceI family protein [Candidatus Kapaibacterium sp.]
MKKLILIGLALIITSSAYSKVEHQVDKSKKNVVKFISDAPVEDFEGVTSSIDGYMLGEEDNFIGTELFFEVDLNTLDTDNGLRDRHMRENYLHTDKYPLTSYEGKIFESKKIEDKHYLVKAKGKFLVHGVSKEKTIEADIYVYDNIYHIKTQFVVTLTDHKIEVPSIMLVKIDPDMDLRLDFFLKEVTK